MPVADAGHLTDFQALQIALKALRQARAMYRRADTIGEKVEREFDRLIKRKTRINAGSFKTLSQRYDDYIRAVAQMQPSLTTAFDVASSF